MVLGGGLVEEGGCNREIVCRACGVWGSFGSLIDKMHLGGKMK